MKVLIAEDDPVVALGLTERLRSLGHDPIGPVSDGEQAVAEAKASLPDLYLFDIEMPTLDGLAAAVTITTGRRRPSLASCTAASTTPASSNARSPAASAPPHKTDRHARTRRGAQTGGRAPRRVRSTRSRGRQGPAGARGPQARRARERAVDVGAQPLRARGLPPTPANPRERNLRLAEVARRIVEQQSLMEPKPNSPARSH
jgi:CheY-like chemotaxis protein